MGIGLSRLFSASELEDPVVGQDVELANSMGLFLQKTNIIRDYLEDQLEGREFWPKEVKEKEYDRCEKEILTQWYECVQHAKAARFHPDHYCLIDVECVGNFFCPRILCSDSLRLHISTHKVVSFTCKMFQLPPRLVE